MVEVNSSRTAALAANERVDPDAVDPLPSEGSEPPEESVELLEMSAQEYADRFGAQDFAGAWDLWTEDARSEVDRATFIAFNEECDTGGSPLEVSGATVVEPGEGAVRVDLARGERAYMLVFEADEWRWVPDEATLTDLAGASPGDLPACP